MLDMEYWHLPITQILRRLKQENHEFKSIMNYTAELREGGKKREELNLKEIEKNHKLSLKLVRK